MPYFCYNFNMNIIRSTTDLAMHLVRPYIRAGSTVIDATCGNGYDTVSLAKAMMEEDSQNCLTNDDQSKSRLFAFDIQQAAIYSTEKSLKESGLYSSAYVPEIHLICDSHENMDKYAKTADVIVFNLGYFPGGDKSITTNAASTLQALNKGVLLLHKDGVICITMYSGHEAGALEKDKILRFAESLNSSDFHVAYVNMINQHSNPPEILLITRKKLQICSL